MTDKCAWLIAWGEGVDPAAQLVAGAARQYGLNIKGQHWPEKEKQAWLASAKEAAQAQAAVILLVTTHAVYAQPENRRALALFRLLLQSLLNRQVDGVVLLQGPPPTEPFPDLFGSEVLGDWMVVGPTDKWVARAVARAHVPTKSSLPLHLSIYAEERLGVWLELRPNKAEGSQGFIAGVSGAGADITFHAVGLSGRLPDKSVNEYELRGLKFDTEGIAFNAWGLQNKIAPEQSYFIRLEGEPDVLAFGALPGGEISELEFVRLA
jgi:hypothetical protein